ncbi:MAG: Acetyl-coenzyme A carboxyl transferase beta chain [Ktedonobacterales bacterium]|nr:MAG: Acetyl-coenzyme A carboxyl transferase beta chain [Ktedonobacterales bacterium]
MRDESKPALPVVGHNGAHPDAVHTLPTNLAVKCPNCRELLVGKDLERNQKVCPRCGYHFRMDAHERIDMLLDRDSFEEFANDLLSADPLGFVSDAKGPYIAELESKRRATGLNESVVVGKGEIERMPLIIVVMDFRFIGGSMGSVAGEKITLGIERATKDRLPLLIISASGGARMQEGLFALMQMAKTSAALRRLADAGVPFISLLTDPTTGGVFASFSMLGDVILAEPGAVIGFTGPRVIEQAMHQKLPKDTNTSEFVLQRGMIDTIVHRRDLRPTIGRILRLYGAASKRFV